MTVIAFFLLGVVLIGTDVLIDRSKNRYARALYDHIITTVGLAIALITTAVNALDYKMGWSWWNSDVGWGDVIVFGFCFPVILLLGGRDWPRRRAAYVRERKIRRGELVRWVRPDILTGEPGTVESVERPEMAARMQERDRQDQERYATRKQRQAELDEQRRISLAKLEELEARQRTKG